MLNVETKSPDHADIHTNVEGCQEEQEKKMHEANDVKNSSEPTGTKTDESQKCKVPIEYICKTDGLFKKDDFEQRISNFTLEITAEKIIVDEDDVIERHLDIDIKIGKTRTPFTIPTAEFANSCLMKRIYEAVGANAILIGSEKDLRIGTQSHLPKTLPLKTVSKSIGLTSEGNFLYPGMLITPEGINAPQDIEVDLSGGNFSKRIGFIMPDSSRMVRLAKHLVKDFLKLKSRKVMYPLMGHICLAPFASSIVKYMGKQKVAMHITGPSGCGKTFITNLATFFYGMFDNSCLSWTSTDNAIEVEGYHFRDTLMVIDDFKLATVDQKKFVRIVQNYANSQGRSRLNPSMKLLKTPYIRGLLLSTGEDFVLDVESVSGRTILIDVEPDQNSPAGMNCLKKRDEYSMFMPGLIFMIISDPKWIENFIGLMNEKTRVLHHLTSELSNGLRIASNWALNALGFEIFITYLKGIKSISAEVCESMRQEYTIIVEEHIKDQVFKLSQQSPVEVFSRVIGQKIATGSVNILDLFDKGSKRSSGKIIGKILTNGNVCIFPDPLMEVLTSHFRSIGQRIPFSKETLKNTLVRNGWINRHVSGRITGQARLSGHRFQAWQINPEVFMKNIIIDIEEK